ncbi:Cyclic nucleotide-gated channel rod photoreceptor subunit alpha [Hypsibius exemplaris]|uniref:Cyclic nucleotide-gated channel rod photoreceptor subunit alpha n=1 Tax=Hypsibius exemplaris TaxID=2072580 RepID=A0A1W0WSV2_HYPEX|nr:Cyclic nucleotide-gated channel rod photoreceptor subunit alpha [Hypsibius exemplaris]
MGRRNKVSFGQTVVGNGVAATAATDIPAEPEIPKDPMQLWIFKFNPKWVIDPEGHGYYYWLFVVSTAIIYNVLFIVPRAVFVELSHEVYEVPFLICDYLADFIYIVDIVVHMLYGYLTEERIIEREPRKLVRHWIKSFYGKLDIISIIPTDFALLATGLEAPYPIIRINRVLKYVRFKQFTAKTEGKFQAADIFRLVVLLFQYLIAMHIFACVYYAISEKVGLNSDIWVYPGEAKWRNDETGNGNDTLKQKYTWCFYFSLHTLTMIGITVQPQKEWQFLFMCLNFVISVMLFSQILGNVSRTIINLDLHEAEFKKRMDGVKHYLSTRNIHAELEQRIISYFEYQWTNNLIVDEKEALACLPEKVESQIAMKVHLETLRHVRIFQGVESGLLADLVLKLKLQVFSPGDYICRKGDIGKELYIVKRGCLEVVSDAGDFVFATISEGSVFGEISILNIVGIKSGNRRTANVRSIGFSDLFCLSKEDLWDALKEYPEGKNKMLELGKQLLIKDNLLDTEAADKAERRHIEFLDKLEHVEGGVDDIQTRFGRLVAERGSSVQKLEKRIAKLDKLLQLRAV